MMGSVKFNYKEKIAIELDIFPYKLMITENYSRITLVN